MKNYEKHLLPEPIGSETHFTWGPVKEIHRIESLNIVIIEYHREVFENNSSTGRYSDSTNFHLHGTSTSYESLESAIIFGIAKHKSIDGSFAQSCCKLMSTT